MLNDTEKEMFRQIRGCFINNDVALIECTVVGSGKEVAAICLIANKVAGNKDLIIPIAVMDPTLMATLEPPELNAANDRVFVLPHLLTEAIDNIVRNIERVKEEEMNRGLDKQ